MIDIEIIKNKWLGFKRLANTFLEMQGKSPVAVNVEAEKAYLREFIALVDEVLSGLPENGSEETEESILVGLQQAIEKESELRSRLAIGSRFHVLQHQLQLLFNQQTASRLAEEPLQTEVLQQGIDPNEQVVYVYLYNAQGARLSTWQALLTNKAFVDHSVNRPVYAKREHIEELLRSKKEQDQHAYVAIKLHKENVMMPLESSILKDAIGNKLLRLKYSSLHPDKVIAFVHKGKKYTLSKEGELVLADASFS